MADGEPLSFEQACEEAGLYGDEPLVTKSGKVLTGADLQALAEEAEAGYDLHEDAGAAGEPRFVGSASAARRMAELLRADAVIGTDDDLDDEPR